MDSATLGLIRVPVKDLAAAKAVYGRLLGVEPYAEAPFYVGFRVGDLELGLDPSGHSRGMTGPVCYWTVTDIQASIDELTKAGATVHEAPSDVGGGMLVGSVKDADGNIIGLSQKP